MPFLVIFGAVIVFCILVVAVNDFRFNRMVNKEIEAIFANSVNPAKQAFSKADLKGLPEPMQAYLARSLKEGQPSIHTVRLKQAGALRLSAEQAWKPFKAEQYFTANPPAFLWRARVAYMPLVWVAGRDTYARQQGNMLIKILSTLTVANAQGPKTASGALIRYVAEMVWFPTALVNNPNLTWETIDATSVKVIACDGSVEAIITVHFNEVGDIARVVSEHRYHDDNDIQPTKWFVDLKEYKEFSGIRLPSQAEVNWSPESGSYTWWRGTITDIEYNVPMRYTS